MQSSLVDASVYNYRHIVTVAFCSMYKYSYLLTYSCVVV